MGGYERKPAAWALDGIPEGFEAKLLPEDWDRMQELFENAIRRVPAIEAAEVKMFFNGPEAFTPGRGLPARRDATFPASGSPPAAARTGSPAPAASARSWPSGSSTAAPSGTSGRSTCTASAGSTAARRTRSRARTRRSRSTTTSSTRARRRRPDGRCASRPVYARHAALGAAFGEKGGWERVNWYESNAAGGDESLRPRGWAGRELVARDRGRGARRARVGRALRPVELLEARGARPGRARRSSSGCARTGSTGPSAPSSTRSC